MAFSPIHLDGLETVRRNWGWVLALGIGLVVLGLLAASAALMTTLATVLFLGVLFLLAGAFEIGNAFRHERYGGFWMHLFTGLLDVVCGSLLFAFPGAGAAALTLVIAVLFLVGGVMRTAAALVMRLPNGGWAMVSGLIDFLLGLLLLGAWPLSALWFLGLCVGIGLFFRGIWWVAFALSVHRRGGFGERHSPA
jgi:uncharacterized membrane protein HdeD (DUF308 family)